MGIGVEEIDKKDEIEEIDEVEELRAAAGFEP